MSPYILSLIRATASRNKSTSPESKGGKHLHLKNHPGGKDKVQSQESDNGSHTFSFTSRKNKETSGAEDNEVQATAIPDPIPADSVSTGTVIRTTLTVLPTFSLASSQISHFQSTTTVWIPAKSTSSVTNSVMNGTAQTASSTTTSRRLPVHVIVLLAIGAIGLALSALMFLRYFIRRHGRVTIPRPSAPILQDSPLFGGKERFSRGIWPDPSFNNLLSSHARTDKGTGWRPLSGGTEMVTEKTQQKRQSTLATTNFAVSRPVSATLSPASVYTTLAPPTTVGAALEFPIPPQTVTSAKQPASKVKDKKAEGKPSRRRSTTASIYGDTDISSPIQTDTEVQYQASGPVPASGKPKSTMKSSGSSGDNFQRAGRKNAPSRASQGSHQRTPSSSCLREKEEPFPYAILSVKDQERRDRDTKALTSALGLGSPPHPPSCFSPVSIYPDDSLSVAHGRVSEMPSPSATHSALGDLMLQEFPSTATFNTLRSGDPFASDSSGKKGTKGRVNDRPPRVPSPPPMPSLSQMALANADPDYRSPTYSIYGLYEAQRKSRRSSMGK